MTALDRETFGSMFNVAAPLFMSSESEEDSNRKMALTILEEGIKRNRFFGFEIKEEDFVKKDPARANASAFQISGADLLEEVFVACLVCCAKRAREVVAR